MKRFKGCLGVFLIFVFGVIVGVGATSGVIVKKVRTLVAGGPDAVVEIIGERLKDELKLDESQKELLRHIIADTRIRLREVRQQTQPQVEETLATAEKKVRAILDPQQQKKFDEIVAKGREGRSGKTKSGRKRRVFVFRRGIASPERRLFAQRRAGGVVFLDRPEILPVSGIQDDAADWDALPDHVVKDRHHGNGLARGDARDELRLHKIDAGEKVRGFEFGPAAAAEISTR